MSFRLALQRRHAVPVAAAALASAAALVPRDAFAEEPQRSDSPPKAPRKPIYDDPTSPPPSKETILNPPGPAPTAPKDAPAASPQDKKATPTERLAAQIRVARLALHGYSVEAEKGLNAFMSRALSLESDFTSTIASLAPPREAKEPLLPGFIYILVATLAGSIVTRNRGIILRTVVPTTFGLTAAYGAIPVTMSNVEGLLGKYEERYPEVKRVHGRISEQSRYIWETGKAHTAMTVQRGENLLDEARRKMEDWVRQGK